MAPLPPVRIEVGAPFEATGLDVFGPFGVKLGGRATHKRWVVIFTCLKVRAVHFEVLQDLSTPTFINALIRFQSRRPGVRKIYSDCGTNFKGAQAALKQAMETWNGSEAAAELQLIGLEWYFTIPYASHRAGVWERLIKDAKKHLSILLLKDNLHLDTFVTIITEVEGIMNRRPITYVSSDPKDSDALTPADLLYPGVFAHSSVNVLPPVPPGGECLRYSWKTARSYIDAFWKRWTSDYVSTLQNRRKWQTTVKDLCVDQLVLLVDELKTRDLWQVGRILEVQGDENHVRQALVRLPNGKCFTRDRTKLVALELDG